MTRPLPDIHDPGFAPFWAGTAAGELRIVFCSDCDQPRWPPRPVCGHCRSFELDWRPVTPTGHLHTWTGVEHQTASDLPPPYVVGLVEIREHPTVRLLGRIVGTDPSRLRVGLPLTARFDPVTDEVTLVNWAPIDDHYADGDSEERRQ